MSKAFSLMELAVEETKNPVIRPDEKKIQMGWQ